MSKQSHFGYAEVAKMQDFRWHYKYSAIFMVWCVGYLEWPELVPFLQKAKERLDKGVGRVTRGSPPESFIFVFENILNDGEDSVIQKGQRVRSLGELESIFNAAGLIINKRSGPKAMPTPFRDVHLWALY